MFFFVFAVLIVCVTALFLLNISKALRYLYIVGLAMSFVFLYGFTNFGLDKSTIKTIIFVFQVFNTLFCLAVLLNKFKFGKYLQYLVWSLPTIIICLVWSYFVYNGKRIGSTDILAIMQTNTNEALLYCSEHVNFMAIMTLLITIVVYVLYCKRFQKRGNLVEGKFYICALISFFLLNLSAAAVECGRGYIKKVSVVIETLNEYSKYNDKISERRNKLKERFDGEKILSVGGVFVLVIGESHCRDYLHAYGYSRETTPWLDEMKYLKNTIFFDKAFSCHTQTVPVLSYALTEKNQYNTIALTDAISIIELANAAGYDTYWISNQAKYSFYGTPTSVLAGSSKQTYWLKENYCDSTIKYDEELIRGLSELKIGKNALVVFHLDGCHAPYSVRYHSDNARFGEETYVDRYDSAVFYNDSVLKNIYEHVNKIVGFKAMVYCSDHGEDVLYSHGHGYNHFLPSMTHIPLYVLVSDRFVEEQRYCFENLRNNAGCVWTNDLLFNLLAGIMGIKNYGCYESNNDLTSVEYDGNVARFRTGHGERMIADDPMFRKE